jgi:hypothetical protein
MVLQSMSQKMFLSQKNGEKNANILPHFFFQFFLLHVNNFRKNI